MLQISLTQDPHCITIRVEGKLTSEDYDQMIPRLEELHQKYGTLNYFIILHDFHGWKAGALWKDLKYEWKHRKDIGRTAIVGDTKWEALVVQVCKTVFPDQVKFFTETEEDAAFEWLSTGRHLAGSKSY